MKFKITCIMLLAFSSGCAQLHHYQCCYLAHRRAAAAWKSACDVCKTGPHARHVERGWRRGYYDVARGGDGRPPLFPPKAYWSFKYQNAEGQQIVQSWYEAYQYGALAADRDGVRQWRYTTTAPYAMAAFPEEFINESPAVDEMPRPSLGRMRPMQARTAQAGSLNFHTSMGAPESAAGRGEPAFPGSRIVQAGFGAHQQQDELRKAVSLSPLGSPPMAAPAYFESPNNPRLSDGRNTAVAKPGVKRLPPTAP